MREQYIDKISTLALLTLGGLSEKELMELPDVSKEDIEAAHQLLKKKGLRAQP